MSDSGNGALTVDDLLAEIRPRETSARVLLRQDLVDQHRRLSGELDAALRADANRNELPAAPEIARQIDDLETEMDGSRREFRFRAVGRRAWADLLAKHPPGKENRGLDHNPATFPAAAIAASCVAPELTVEQAYRFYEAMDVAQWDTLYGACLDANVGGDVPKSAAASMTLRMNGRYASSAMATAAPSPDPSSLDE